MKRLETIWRTMTGAERIVFAAATLALVVTLVAAASALVKRPADISNPDAEFNLAEGVGKQAKKRGKPAEKRTVDWTRFGYDVGRSKFLDAQHVGPPFRRVWRYEGEELIEFPPIVVDGRLYFIDNDGVYVALDARTGKVLWKKQHASLNASSPAYEKGVLYSVSLSPQQALAIRARDGKVLWRKSLPNRAESSPLVVRGRMYFGDEGGNFYALRSRDGKTIWQQSVAGSVKAAPALRDGVLYFGDYGGQMNALRAGDGKPVWQVSDLGVGLGQSGRFYSTPAIAFGRVYVGNVDNRVYSFDADTGEVAWTFSTGNYVYSGIAAADTGGTKPTVYFGSHDASAYAVDARTGKLRWKQRAGGQVSGPATVVGDVFYLSTFSGNATIGFDLDSGRRVFKFEDGEYGPVVSDGQSIYLTGGVTVIRFDPVDTGGLRYKRNKGQRGIVPPAELRRITKRLRDRASKQQPGGGQSGGGQDDQDAPKPTDPKSNNPPAN